MAPSPPDTLSLLRELNDALLLEQAPHVEWVICGGAALAIQGLSRRTTQDVDVLGSPIPEGVAIGPFPPAVVRAIDRVAAAHPQLRGLGRAWVNTGPQELARRGLPKGFSTRLVVVPIGPRFTLHALGRVDLIALKLLASADDLGPRHAIHLDDLQALNPSAGELGFAIDWALQMPDADERIRHSLKHVLTSLGHEDLAYYV